MLRATTSLEGLWTTHWDFQADGRSVATWTGKTRRTWGPRFELAIDGVPYVLEATRVSSFRLDGPHSGGRADRTKSFSFRKAIWDVSVDDAHYRLRGGAAGKQFAVLVPGTGEQVGRISRSYGLRPTYEADLPDGLSIPAQVFVLWVAMTIWRRTQLMMSS